jgi:hypothetical protein
VSLTGLATPFTGLSLLPLPRPSETLIGSSEVPQRRPSGGHLPPTTHPAAGAVALSGRPHFRFALGTLSAPHIVASEAGGGWMDGWMDG